MSKPKNEKRECEERAVWDAMCRAGLYDYATTFKCCPEHQIDEHELALAKSVSWECADAVAVEVVRRLEGGSPEVRSDELLDAVRSTEVQQDSPTMRAYEVWARCGIQFAHDRYADDRRYGLERTEGALRIYRA